MGGSLSNVASGSTAAQGADEPNPIALLESRDGSTLDVSFEQDGSVMKNQLCSGSGCTPLEGSQVRLMVEAATDGTKMLGGFKGPSTFDFRLGDGEVCDALECCVARMCVGERAIATCTRTSHCKCDKLGLEVTSASKVVLTMELVDSIRDTHAQSVNAEEVLDFAERRANVGAVLQKKGRFALAVERYTAVSQLLSSSDIWDAKQQPRVDSLLMMCKVNTQASMAYWVKTERALGRERGTILVCQGSSCQQAGSNALVAEIEELAGMVGGCKVESTSCLGSCGRGPNAAVADIDANGLMSEVVFRNLDSPQKSADVLERAKGAKPPLDPVMLDRLSRARVVSTALQMRASTKWNKALKCLRLAEEVADEDNVLEVVSEHADVLESAGLYEAALERNDWLISMASMNGELRFRRACLLGKVGRHSEAEDLLQKLVEEFKGDTTVYSKLLGKAKTELADLKATAALETSQGATTQQQPRIYGYAYWTVNAIEPISHWSALIRLRSSDPRRETVCWESVWHITLLAAVGDNSEGPLPWIERDYTPVSSADDWNLGRCDLLVKVYERGLATQWLRNRQCGSGLFLSCPRPALFLPSLADVDRIRDAFVPSDVLFVVGGSGITPALQALPHFRDLQQPLSVLYSCGADDVVALDTLESYVAQRVAKTRVLVAVTPARKDNNPPFVVRSSCSGGEVVGGKSVDGIVSTTVAVGTDKLPQEVDATMGVSLLLEKAKQLHPSLEFHDGRITTEMLSGMLAEADLEKTRVVVSGPQSLNDLASNMLVQYGVRRAAITLMQASV
eukprot:TRINITY_DN61440_c0_g1_i1.p1 TRINITY_DN61440_c0_g1~~TRINITY_DN61440_c0_g1_i1.p1  ORF type:complete len:795 (+),score=154.73 TRINITY_DN61440_c0_g1_i1:198-2582(+)